MGYGDMYGGDDNAADVLGAIFSRGGARRGNVAMTRSGPAVPGSQHVFTRPPLPPEAGSGNIGALTELRSAMGMGIAVWTAADAADKPLVVRPQESFRGERLVLDVGASGGTSAGLVVVRSINVGTQPQSPSVEQPMPASMFSPQATEANLDLQIAFRAINLQVTLGITAAPGAGVTVTATCGFYGQWIR